MKRTVATVTVLLVLTTLTAGAFLRHDTARPQMLSLPVTRGPIVNSVAATGTLEPVTTVQVGTQISGTVQTLDADFNSLVRKGQVVARLDPSLYRTAVEQARANVAEAQANLERLTVTAADAKAALARTEILAARQLVAETDLEAAQLASRSADAQVRSGQAQVTQARAALSQADVNLDKTIITSPIDGIVIARSVDVGQTVAASLQAPTLFEVAADLREMQVDASIDEADLGRIAVGQGVSFTVDAYPNRHFSGTVEQIRLNPVVSSNVVTYTTIVSAPNPDRTLKPGMTASLVIAVSRRDNVLRVPIAALQFRPPADVLEAYGATPLPVTGVKDMKTVWLTNGGSLRAASIRIGASDDGFAEVLDGSLAEGTSVATRVGAATARSTTVAAGNPLIPMGQRPTR